jgi:hypothetical protein
MSSWERLFFLLFSRCQSPLRPGIRRKRSELKAMTEDWKSLQDGVRQFFNWLLLHVGWWPPSRPLVRLLVISPPLSNEVGNQPDVESSLRIQNTLRA